MITEGSRPRSPAPASSCAPLGLTRAYTAQNGKVTEQKKVSFKVELDTSVPEQASFKQFLEQFDDATKATILANYPKMTRAKDENASEDQKKMAIDFNFKYPTIKVTEDKQGNARKPAFKANILSRAARDGKDKPDIKDPANWLINVYKISDEGELEKAEPSMLTERGLTAKITFELRVTNSQMGYTTALTARSVVILDQSSTNDAAAMAAWADDEDVQEFKKRKLAAKGASPPQAEAPAYDADAADDY